jgi:hypothetical protein
MRSRDYWVQVDLHNRLLILAHYIIVLVKHKDFSKSVMDEEVLSSLYKNKKVAGLV